MLRKHSQGNAFFDKVAFVQALAFKFKPLALMLKIRYAMTNSGLHPVSHVLFAYCN